MQNTETDICLFPKKKEPTFKGSKWGIHSKYLERAPAAKHYTAIPPLRAPVLFVIPTLLHNMIKGPK